jgi:hypothetical protein
MRWLVTTAWSLFKLCVKLLVRCNNALLELKGGKFLLLLSIMIHFMGKTVWCIMTVYASFARAGKCFHVGTIMCGAFGTTESRVNFGAGT